METKLDQAPPGTPSAANATRRILSTVVFNLVVYLLIGLPLAVLPGLVHFNLGFSAAFAGFMISLQYAATLITRPAVGRVSDRRGPKSAVLAGLTCAIISGICMIAAAGSGKTWIILTWLAFSRIWLGAAESGTGTGCITWGIGQTGAAHTAAVMSWNGVASYGGIALGAPAGVFLYHEGGLMALGIATAGLSSLGLALCVLKPGTPVVAGARMGFAIVLRRVLPYGACLALGSVGFGTLVAFITLFYAAHGWHNAAYALSAFGIAFVLVRVLLSGVIRRFGGLTASAVSFAIELAGLLALWRAGSPDIAIIGAALTGLGLSLIFPAMAVEALKTVPISNRGAAIGLYTVFLDVSLGATGPAAGLIIGQVGYPAVYLLAALAAATAEAMTFGLMMAARR